MAGQEYLVKLWVRYDEPLTDDQRTSLELSIRNGAMNWPQDFRPDDIVDAEVQVFTDE